MHRSPRTGTTGWSARSWAWRQCRLAGGDLYSAAGGHDGEAAGRAAVDRIVARGLAGPLEPRYEALRAGVFDRGRLDASAHHGGGVEVETGSAASGPVGRRGLESGALLPSRPRRPPRIGTGEVLRAGSWEHCRAVRATCNG